MIVISGNPKEQRMITDDGKWREETKSQNNPRWYDVL
jgi:hypothetical protein